MPNAIFISYRRDDTEGEAGRLFDDLVRAFGPDNVFMDVAGIRPGADFRKAIEESVAHCGVLLAVIGPTWLTVADHDGQPRLANPNDYVSLEIASALKRDVPVIPVLVHGAHMAHADQLPAALESFAYRNSVELTHARWNSDVQLLITALHAYVTPAAPAEPVHATIPAQLPPPHTPSTTSKTPNPMRRPLIIGAAVLGLLLILLALYEFPLFPGAKPAPTPAPLTGTWVDPNPRPGNNLVKLTFDSADGQTFMSAYGDCQAGACNWGRQLAKATASAASANFTIADQPAGVQRSVLVSVERNGTGLDVLIMNTFTNATGVQKNGVKRSFVAAP